MRLGGLLTLLRGESVDVLSIGSFIRIYTHSYIYIFISLSWPMIEMSLPNHTELESEPYPAESQPTSHAQPK